VTKSNIEAFIAILKIAKQIKPNQGNSKILIASIINAYMPLCNRVIHIY
jgi:hypothetical protein